MPVYISPSTSIGPDIEELLDKREANCRKLMSLARSKMGVTDEEPVAPEADETEWVSRFLSCFEQGNLDQMLSLLTEDVMLVSDGGGKVLAFTRPIHTRDQVARILAGAFEGIKPYYQGRLHSEFAPLNGGTGIVLRSGTKLWARYLYNVDMEKFLKFTSYETRIS